MKKLVVALLAMMGCSTRCDKNKEAVKAMPENIFRGKRVAEKSAGNDSYNSSTKFTYDNDGHLILVNSFYKGELRYEDILTYDNNKLTVIKKNRGEIVYETTYLINKKGFVEFGVEFYYEEDQGITTKYTTNYEFKYTADGYLSEVKEVEYAGTAGESINIIKYLYSASNLISRSEFYNGEKTMDSIYTVGTVINKDGAIYTGDFECVLFYAGVLGKTSKKLIIKEYCSDYYSASPAIFFDYYDYELDKEGYVLKVKTKKETNDEWNVRDTYTYN